MLSVSASACKLQIWWTTSLNSAQLQQTRGLFFNEVWLITVFFFLNTHFYYFPLSCWFDLQYKTFCKPPCLSCFQNLFMLADAHCGHLAGVSKISRTAQPTRGCKWLKQIEGEREKHHQASLHWLPASSHLKESSRQSNSGTFTFALHWRCHSLPDETFLRQCHEGVIFSEYARYDTLHLSEPFNLWK